jgi:hypothetical protein
MAANIEVLSDLIPKVPGMHGDLVEAVTAFCAADLTCLDQTGLQQHAVHARQLAQRLLGCADQALGVLHRRYQGQVLEHPDTDGATLTRSVQGWWRDAAVRTGQHAGTDTRRADVLQNLPLLGQAVVDGVLAQEQVAVLIRLHDRIPLAHLQASQQHLITVARGQNTEALGKWVAHQIATHCEPALEDDEDKAHDKRFLQLRTSPDGTVRGSFRLASEDAEAVRTVLEPLARRQGLEDTRSAGQRRADALVDVFTGATSWADLPDAGGQRAQLSYVISSDWAAGVPAPDLPTQLRTACTAAANPAGAAASAGLHPLALAKYAPEAAWTGPQTHARIEAVLCDARISRLLLDPHGTVLSLEALADAITPAQRKAVSARDRHCVAKGCTRPPAFCDVHHLTHREHGGITSVDNLVLLCRRHHVLWHRGTLGLHDLHVPWLHTNAEPAINVDPWDGHNPPLIA